MVDIKDIKIPDINWDKVEVLDQKTAIEKAEKSVEFLINFRMFSFGTGFLMKRNIQEEAEKVRENLKAWIKEYKGFFHVVQRAFLEKAKEIAAKDGDSRTLFSRLRVLALEALFHKAVRNWDSEEKVATTPYRLRRDFLSRVRMGRNETMFLLPDSWRNDTQKSIALVLKDLERKAKRKWMEEKGYEPRKPEKEAEDKKEAPAETPEKEVDAESLVAKKTPEIKPEPVPETKPEPKPEPKKTKPKPKKSAPEPKTPKKDEADKKAAKRVKKVRVKNEEKEAEAEIRAHLKAEAKQDGASASLTGKLPLDVVAKKSKK